jgi:diacylglycerol kinase
MSKYAKLALLHSRNMKINTAKLYYIILFYFFLKVDFIEIFVLICRHSSALNNI